MMNVLAERYWLTALLSLGIAASAGVVAWQTDFGRALVGAPKISTASQRAATETKLAPAFALPPLESAYSEMRDRPLFIPTRRPAPQGTGAQVAMKKGQFRLTGTTVSEQISVAYLFEAATNKTHRVNKGAEINGIMVDVVAANRVTLKQGDEIEELSLRTSTSPKPPPPPPPQVAGVAGQPGMPGVPVSPTQVPMPAGAVANAAPGQFQQGVAALPGVPGGNFGPPLQQGAAPGGSPTPQGTLGMQVNPNAVAPGATNPANQANPSNDPNQPQLRRRRFQNLPQ
jgi:general secretion pathway protein N